MLWHVVFHDKREVVMNVVRAEGTKRYWWHFLIFSEIIFIWWSNGWNVGCSTLGWIRWTLSWTMTCCFKLSRKQTDWCMDTFRQIGRVHGTFYDKFHPTCHAVSLMRLKTGLIKPTARVAPMERKEPTWTSAGGERELAPGTAKPKLTKALESASRRCWPTQTLFPAL